MKNIKILLILIMTMSQLFPKGYVGAKIGVIKNSDNAKFTSINDSFSSSVTAVDETGHKEEAVLDHGIYSLQNSEMQTHRISKNFGMLAGYQFDNLHTSYKPFVELDFEFRTQNKTSSMTDFVKGKNKFNELSYERTSIRSKNSFGIMLGTDAVITDSFSAVLGVRFNASKYEVMAQHLTKDPQGNFVENPQNTANRNTYFWGIEPTIGFKYKITDHVACRFTTGYNIGQSKTVIKNYIGSDDLKAKNVSAGLKLKPRSLNFTVALIYTF